MKTLLRIAAAVAPLLVAACVVLSQLPSDAAPPWVAPCDLPDPGERAGYPQS